MFKSEMHEFILSLISKDRENPTQMTTLKSRTGLSRRAITDIIRDLRIDYPICSTKIAPGGYWLGKGSDLQALIADMRSTATTLLASADNLNQLLIDDAVTFGHF